jgi:hypothetical protein
MHHCTTTGALVLEVVSIVTRAHIFCRANVRPACPLNNTDTGAGGRQVSRGYLVRVCGWGVPGLQRHPGSGRSAQVPHAGGSLPPLENLVYRPNRRCLELSRE